LGGAGAISSDIGGPLRNPAGFVKRRAAAFAATLLLGFSGTAFAFGAIAVDDQKGTPDPGYGYGWGPTKAVATKKALEMCGNKNCEVHVTKCE
jgi:hypothetical protein